jgi:putative component of membrane protein insertase Oxa1/YidC/SpoIIIJ protein YidD
MHSHPFETPRLATVAAVEPARPRLSHRRVARVRHSGIRGWTGAPGFHFIASGLRLPRYLLAYVIRIYQRHISPRKGYQCAHRLLHGGWSCSEFGLRAVTRHGVIGFARLMRRRFAACAQANLALYTKLSKEEPVYTEFPWRECSKNKTINTCGNYCATAPWL